MSGHSGACLHCMILEVINLRNSMASMDSADVIEDIARVIADVTLQAGIRPDDDAEKVEKRIKCVVDLVEPHLRQAHSPEGLAALAQLRLKAMPTGGSA